MTEIIFDANEDWENRILCGDESCIGTIGSDGKCKECGKAYEGDLPEKSIEVGAQKAEVNDQSSSVAKDDNDEWDKRVLCGDESCIGVIGPDGKCTECGKSL